MTTKTNYVAYYRVSTEEQGKTGLGLRAQKRDVTKYISENGNMVGEFEDIESGTSETRGGMLDAIEACKRFKAVLVVKELSRISRGGYKFRDALETSKIDFIECNSPHDPEVVKDIKFSLAREERKMISERTSKALNEIKEKLARGEKHISKSGRVVTKLGMESNLSDEGRKKAQVVRMRNAHENPENKKAGGFIIACRAAGDSFPTIADKLNEYGFLTRRGNKFTTIQAQRLFKRYSN